MEAASRSARMVATFRSKQPTNLSASTRSESPPGSALSWCEMRQFTIRNMSLAPAEAKSHAVVLRLGLIYHVDNGVALLLVKLLVNFQLGDQPFPFQF